MFNEEFEEKVNFLNLTLRDSIERLLVEVKSKGALLPPYGRPSTPTPFVDEDDAIVQDLDLDDEDTRNDADDAAASFQYEYGFNPLTFLAEFIHRAHPDSIAERRRRQANARQRLCFRATHARNQLDTAADLGRRSEQLRSGIIHGPLTYPVSSTSIMFFCRTVKAGDVTVELAKESSFTSVSYQSCFQSNGPQEPLKVLIGDLESGTKYFCRCHFRICPEQDSIDPTHYAYSHFWTMVNCSVDDDDDKHQDVELFAINGRTRHRMSDNSGPMCFELIDDEVIRPLYSVFVGDFFNYDESKDTSDAYFSPNSLDAQLWQLFRRDPLFAPWKEQEPNSILNMSSILCAWNDSQKGSETGLKAEEIVHKQWSYDTKKYEKRQKERLEKEKNEAFEQKTAVSSTSAKKRNVTPAPVLSRPAMSNAFNKIVMEMPFQYYEDNVRHLYRSVQVSRDVEVFFLDSRNGYLGKEQVRWLKDCIRKSSSPMKIIYSGCAFGFHLVDQLTVEKVEVPTTDAITEERVQVADVIIPDGSDVVTGQENLEEISESAVVRVDTATSLDNNLQGKSTPGKKVSSSRQRALEATKEEFDDDGLSKSSLAHVVVSTHRKLYPLSERTNNDDDDEPKLESKMVESKLELTGGILIVSSTNCEESFVARYNFARNAEEEDADECFCLEVGLGFACEGSSPRICDETPNVSAADSLLSRGRKILYRSSVDYCEGNNSNSLSCSIVVKQNGMLDVVMKQVDTNCVVFKETVSSALSN